MESSTGNTCLGDGRQPREGEREREASNLSETDEKKRRPQNERHAIDRVCHDNNRWCLAGETIYS